MWPFTTRGKWLDHQCRKPYAQKAAIGDRWECECGRVWRVQATGSRYVGGDSVKNWIPA